MSAAETGSRHSSQEIENLGPLHALSEDAITDKQEERRPSPLNFLTSNIPAAKFNIDFSAITGASGSEDSAGKDRIEKRKSNLSKLNEENEKLRRELKALSDRLEAAERKRAQLQAQD